MDGKDSRRQGSRACDGKEASGKEAVRATAREPIGRVRYARGTRNRARGQIPCSYNFLL